MMHNSDKLADVQVDRLLLDMEIKICSRNKALSRMKSTSQFIIQKQRPPREHSKRQNVKDQGRERRQKSQIHHNIKSHKRFSNSMTI